MWRARTQVTHKGRQVGRLCGFRWYCRQDEVVVVHTCEGVQDGKEGQRDGWMDDYNNYAQAKKPEETTTEFGRCGWKNNIEKVVKLQVAHETIGVG